MILRNQLRRLALRLGEQCEVLDEIEKMCRLTNASDHRLQTDPAFLTLIIDLFPLSEVFPACGHAPDPTLRPVRHNDDCVVPEELRDRVPIVGEVVLEGVLK